MDPKRLQFLQSMYDEVSALPDDISEEELQAKFGKYLPGKVDLSGNIDPEALSVQDQLPPMDYPNFNARRDPLQPLGNVLETVGPPLLGMGKEGIKSAPPTMATAALTGLGASVAGPFGAAGGAALSVPVNAGIRYLEDLMGGAITGEPVEDKGVGDYLLEGAIDVPFGAIPGARAGLAARAKPAMRSAKYMEDPSIAAALRLADNRGILDDVSKASSKAIEGKGLVTPQIQTEVGLSQQEAKFGINPGVKEGGITLREPTDPLWATAWGSPSGSGAGVPRGKLQIMEEAGPELNRSNILDGGAVINPYTGVFEGNPMPARTTTDVINKSALAQAHIMEARSNAVTALDTAMDSVNKVAPGEGKIRGVIFDFDVAPELSELRKVTSNRELLIQTEPMGSEMRNSYTKVRESFGRIENSPGFNRFLSMGPAGNFERGELRPSQVVVMLEDLNAYRRAVGEFDTLVRAKGMQGTVSDLTGRDAELYALGKIQGAVSKALESKTGEILAQAKSLPGYYQWSDEIKNLTPQSIPQMNKSYGAMTELERIAVDYEATTARGLVYPEPGRLITAVNKQQGGFPVSKYQVLDRIAHWLVPGTGTNKPAALRAETLARETLPTQQILDTLFLRERPIPILPRDWNKVRHDSVLKQALNVRAQMLGYRGAIEEAPEWAQKEMHKQIVLSGLGVEAAPQGYQSVIDGRFTNPAEADIHLNEALNLEDPKQRAGVVGGVYENKYVPTDTTKPNPVNMNPRYNTEAISAMPTPSNTNGVATDYSEDDSVSSMLQELQRAQALHAE